MTMYIARIIFGKAPYVHPIDATEWHVPRDYLRGATQHARRKRAWRFGYGVAAISDTPHAAIGAAKALLERVR